MREPSGSLKGLLVSSGSNDSGGRLEKAAREGASAVSQYEAEARATREKTARLRELRLAREAAEGKSAPAAKRAPAKKAGKPAKTKPVGLADYLNSQERSGRRG
jgi:hypothetical protein